jgi:hypothetical protein
MWLKESPECSTKVKPPSDWLGYVKNRKRVALLAAAMGTGNKYKNKKNSILNSFSTPLAS